MTARKTTQDAPLPTRPLVPAAPLAPARDLRTAVYVPPQMFEDIIRSWGCVPADPDAEDKDAAGNPRQPA